MIYWILYYLGGFLICVIFSWLALGFFRVKNWGLIFALGYTWFFLIGYILAFHFYYLSSNSEGVWMGVLLMAFPSFLISEKLGNAAVLILGDLQYFLIGLFIQKWMNRFDLEGWRKKISALLIDAFLILMPGILWMFVFGRVQGFQDMGSMAPVRSLFLKVIIAAGILYLIIYLYIQTTLFLKRKQTIGKKIMSLK
jgi:hypothetical protein